MVTFIIIVYHCPQSSSWVNIQESEYNSATLSFSLFNGLANTFLILESPKETKIISKLLNQNVAVTSALF